MGVEEMIFRVYGLMVTQGYMIIYTVGSSRFREGLGFPFTGSLVERPT